MALDTKLYLNLVWVIDLEALKARDPQTSLYPFLQAAKGTRETVMGVTNYNCPLDRIYRLLMEDPSVVQLVSEYGFAHSSSSGRDYAYGREESLGHLMSDMWNAGHAMMAVAVIVVLMSIFLQYLNAGSVIPI